MNWLDVTLAAILLWSVISGAAKGLARISIGLVATILGVLFASRWYAQAGGYLREYVNSPVIANSLGFVLVLVLFVAAGGLISLAVAAIFHWTGVTWIDRLLGAVFGLLRGLLIAMAIVMIGMAFPKDTMPQAIIRSRIAPYVAEAASVLAALAPAELEAAFCQNYAAVQRTWTQVVTGTPPSTPREQ